MLDGDILNGVDPDSIDSIESEVVESMKFFYPVNELIAKINLKIFDFTS